MVAQKCRSARGTYPPLSVAALDLMMIARPRIGPWQERWAGRCGVIALPFADQGRHRAVPPFLHQFVVFAQAQAPQAAPPGDPNAGLRMVVMVAGLLLMGYFLFVRPMKQKEQEARKMVMNLKENDRVVTIGGIHGVVTNVQRDVERVTIRVDESTGAKLKLNLSAIARVVTADDPETTGAGSNKS
jgi:preprotein translocase subunit YajC